MADRGTEGQRDRGTEIIASFSYGKLLTRKRERVARVGFSLLCVVQLTMILVLIFLISTGNFYEDDAGFVIIGLNVFFLFFLAIGFLSIRSNNNRKNKVKTWLKDVVEIEAKILCLDVTVPHSTPYQVEAYFKYNDQNLIRTNKPGTIFTGSHKILTKYHNKTIRILYSPKYDEILIPSM